MESLHDNRGRGFLYGLDPRSKMLNTLIILVLTLATQKIHMYFFILIFLVLIIFSSRLNFLEILKRFSYFVPIFFVILMFNIFFINVGEVLVDLKIVKIYSKSLIFTATAFSQIFLITAAMEIFTGTTAPEKIMKGINYILRKKNRNSEIGLLFTVSLQFIPVIQEEFRKIQKIQKSRGGNPRKELVTVIIPLFRVTMQRVGKMTKIMRAKNFWINGEKTEFEELRIGKNDFISTIAVLIFSFFYLFCYFLF